MQQELSDAELDAIILGRLKLAGIDLSVLPEDDSAATVDRRRILASARRLLRSTPSAVRAFAIDRQDVPPILYPSAFRAWTGGGAER
ncbi:MAG: hypothetical protein ACREL7_16845 [Longimicrobiales bacterium]